MIVVQDIVASALILIGAAFSLLAAIGLLRFGDTFLRMHAATKAGAFGSVLILGGMAIAFWDVSVTVRSILTVSFLLLTTPVAAHLLGRALLRKRPSHKGDGQ